MNVTSPLSCAALLFAITTSVPADAEQKSPAAPATVAAAPKLVKPDQKAARELAERLYNTWRLSMSRGDEVTWESVTPRSRQVKVRNIVRSNKGTMRDDFFGKNAEQLPPLENFRFVGALASADRRCMSVTYLGKLQTQEGQAPQPVTYVLYFVDESGKGRWTFDQSRFYSLEHLAPIATRLAEKDNDVLMDEDLFHPYKSVPAVPRACAMPEVVAQVFVDSPGRNIVMTINGEGPYEFYDERRADIILGGLKKGKNVITYEIKDVDGAPRDSMAIGLFLMPEAEGQRPSVVYEHILDADGKAKGGSFTFTVGNSHLAMRNPSYTGPKPTPFRPVPLKKKEN